MIVTKSYRKENDHGIENATIKIISHRSGSLMKNEGFNDKQHRNTCRLQHLQMSSRSCHMGWGQGSFLSSLHHIGSSFQQQTCYINMTCAKLSIKTSTQPSIVLPRSSLPTPTCHQEFFSLPLISLMKSLPNPQTSLPAPRSAANISGAPK